MMRIDDNANASNITIGERHIRFWYFQRPNNTHNGGLTYKVGSMSQLRNV